MDSIFKIVFSQGELVQSKFSFFGVSMDTIFTVFITLLVFFLGFIINKIIERRQQLRRLKELEEFYLQMLFLLKNPVEKQILELKNFSRILLAKKEQNIEFKIVTNFVIDQIKETNNKDLYDIFVRNQKGVLSEKTELYSKLKTQIAFIDEKNSSLKSDFVLFITDYEKYVIDYKNSLKAAMELLLNFSSDATSEQESFINELSKIASDWQKVDNPRDLFVSKLHLIDKAQLLLKSFSNTPMAATFNNYIMECVYNYDNILHLKETFSNYFDSSSNELKIALDKIEQAIERFEELRR